MGAIKDVMSSLFLDATDEEKARTFRLVFRIVVAVHILWACGLLSPIGLNGFVQAEELDPKIQAAVEPLRTEIGKIARTQDEQAGVLKAIRTDQVASKLRDLQALRCKSTDHDRDRLDQEMEVAQRQYRELTGERYPLEACD